MKVLKPVSPTPEQLAVINLPVPGPVVIRGAAGSGKTTTALYRLKQSVKFWQRRVRDGYATGPVRVLVLTYNKTLRGYLEELARTDVSGNDVELSIETFGRWSYHATGQPALVGKSTYNSNILRRAGGIRLADNFLLDEVRYVMGRFLPADLSNYLTCERIGRGSTPRVAGPVRERILDEIVGPYLRWRDGKGLADWDSMAVDLASTRRINAYDVVVVDETQDFSANQMRAVVNHLAVDYSATFVLDGAQRIYPQRFQWNEIGVTVGPNNSRQLSQNHRNTRPIASLAAPLLTSVEVTDDSAVPDVAACARTGPRPVLVPGAFPSQMDYVIAYLRALDPDAGETVAVLHAKGGGWFDEVRRRLTAAGFAFVEITGESEWPTGPESIVLSTMHSAKGLEFDHVIIVGLNSVTMPHGAEPGDSERDAHQRLMSMAIGRARSQVVITYKPDEASDVISCLDPATYDTVTR